MNDRGQLGIGYTSLKKHQAVMFIKFSTNIIDVKCGDYHTLFLSEEGKVYACGDGR